jgi:hypothetical protein
MYQAFNSLVKPQTGSRHKTCRNVNQAIEIDKISTVRIAETNVCRDLEDFSGVSADIDTKVLTAVH